MKHHYTIVLVALLLAVGIAVAAVASQPAHSRSCFPASSWDADQGKRPCVEVTRVEEDGSFRFRAFDADGTTRYTSGVGALDR